nr:hypothetical protein [Tanacetum cinerariifolium]
MLQPKILKTPRLNMFIHVHNGGHMVPVDQPTALLRLESQRTHFKFIKLENMLSTVQKADVLTRNFESINFPPQVFLSAGKKRFRNRQLADNGVANDDTGCNSVR